MVDIKTPLPQGPAIVGQATTNLSPGLAPPSVFTSSSSGGGFDYAAASQAALTAIGTLGNLASKRSDRKWQAKMYKQLRADSLVDYARQRSDYLLDLANERAYNSPSAQVSRLLAAGINPNVAAGAGGMANTSSSADNTAEIRATDIPTPSRSSNFGSAFISDMSGVIGSSNAQVQGRLLGQEIETKKAQALSLLSNSDMLREDARYKSVVNSYLDSFMQIESKQRIASLNETISRSFSIAASTVKTQAESDFITRQSVHVQQIIDNYATTLENIKANTSLSYAQRDKYAQEALTEVERALGLWYDNANKDFDFIVKSEYGTKRAVNDMKFHRWFDPLSSSLGIVLDGVATVYGFGGVINHFNKRNPIGFNTSWNSKK